MFFRSLCTLFVVTTLAAAGCSQNDGPQTYPVSGTVTYEGKPLKEGQIAFIPDTTKVNVGPPYSCKVVDGKFSGKSTPGIKKIEVYGSWETGEMMQMDDGSGQTPVRKAIPSKFNELSEIEIELKPEANEDLAIELK